MNEKPPTVSVIISTYNRAHMVGRAIRSVLGQTYRDFELIVVNDASTDHTDEVLNSFNDKRIRYVRFGENRGGPAARNTGIKMARGKYIAFLDDDDEWLPAKLEKQVEKMKDVTGEVGLIYSGSEVIADDSNTIQRRYHPEQRGNVHKRLLLGPMVGSVSNVLVKKECFIKVGLFDESLKSCQDWDMWKRISDHYEFDFVPEILSRIHLHPDQISSDLASLIPGRERMVEKYIEEFREHPEILVVHLKRLGKLHCINGTWKGAAYWFKEALKVNIFEIIKISAWCIIRLPVVKFYSRAKNFRKYRKNF